MSYSGGAVTGQCIAKSQCASPNVVTAGLCPGDSSIACCHNPAPVRTYESCGTNGQCQDVSTCTGTVKRGLCAGASNIACCENGAPTAAALTVPVSSPRALFAVEVVVNDTTTFGEAPPAWTAEQLTLCTAGNGQQGFCMDGSVGNAVCNGVPTYPSSCESPAVCCTPQPCQLTNTTSGVCIPPTECLNQAGFVSTGYCGANGVDGQTSCCTGVGLSQCDTQGLLACLLADGDPTICASSFHCPPLPDYSSLNSAVQSAPASGLQAHDGVTDTITPATTGGDGLGAAGMTQPEAYIAAIVAIITILLAIMQ